MKPAACRGDRRRIRKAVDSDQARIAKQAACCHAWEHESDLTVLCVSCGKVSLRWDGMVTQSWDVPER